MVLAQSMLERFPSVLNVFGQPMTIFGLPVDRDTIFKDRKGRYRTGIEKRQRNLIAKTTFINFFLDHGERIRCLTIGFSPIDSMEQLLTGPAFLYFKRAYFIFTDKRIFHIPGRVNHHEPGAVSQMVYENCTRIMLKGRSLVVHYTNGERETFPYIHRKERRKIKSLLAGMIFKPNDGHPSQGRQYLCPSCTHVLETASSMCDACKLKFKSSRQAVFRALLIPGGGYFYNRYPVLGFMVGIMETALMVSFAYQWSALRAGLAVGSQLTAVWIIALMAEKIIAAFHTARMTRDFIPDEKEFAIRRI